MGKDARREHARHTHLDTHEMAGLMTVTTRAKSLGGLNARKTVRQPAGLRGGRLQVRAERPNAGETFPRDWLKKDNMPFWAGYFAWTLPSCIPVGAFGPGLADPFWIYLITWHLGLFIALTLAKIGIEGRKEGYFGEAPPRDERNPMR